MPALNLVLCVLQAAAAIRHPSTEHTWMAICWGLITFLNTITFWGTYWKVTPQGISECRLLFVRRLIPYNIIQDVSPNDATSKRQAKGQIRVSIFLGEPLLARPVEYERFVSALEQHLDPGLIHV